MSTRAIRLTRLGMPSFTASEARPIVPPNEYERRLEALSERMSADWIVVYGDREHFANLAFLCGFDPRFEEAVLVLGKRTRQLFVGNEGLSLARLLPVDVDVIHVPSLSLVGQARHGLTLRAALGCAGIGAGANVGVVGWKYLTQEEWDLATPAIAAPAFLIDLLRDLTESSDHVFDATDELLDSEGGLRSTSTADQLAAFEWMASRATQAVSRIVRSAIPGMSERELASHMGYAGEPLSVHVMLSSGEEVDVGLRSATDRKLELGDAVTTAVGYWGGLGCRAGLLVANASELRTESAGYLDELAVPYWGAISEWYEALEVGVVAGELDQIVRDRLASAGFEPALNPGHLGHLDEWLNSPITPGSEERLRSGMVLQCDVIPSSARGGWAVNCEDPLALADRKVRSDLETRYPATWSRIVERRSFMTDALGIELSPDVLPFSAIPAFLPTFWLDPDSALAYRGSKS